MERQMISRVTNAVSSRPRFSEKQWFFAITFLILLLATHHNFLRFIPAGQWLEVPVDGIHVHDTVEGAPAPMDVQRTIHKPFFADWVVTVMRQLEDGEFTTFCTARGVNDYAVDAQLPDELNLDWWTWPVECDPPAGSYQVRTAWSLQLQGGIEKTIRRRSNVFTVSPAPPEGQRQGN
jgi:hypothetical protein